MLIYTMFTRSALWAAASHVLITWCLLLAAHLGPKQLIYTMFARSALWAAASHVLITWCLLLLCRLASLHCTS